MRRCPSGCVGREVDENERQFPIPNCRRHWRRWSIRQLAAIPTRRCVGPARAPTRSRGLTKQGPPVSARTVGRLLRAAGYSLQGNRKTKEGGSHPDRNAQFEHINDTVKRFQRRRQPVISVDTKKKELVGDFKNGGREWRPHGAPDEVRVHDFLDKKLGKAIPYGVYDLTHNQGWVSVGIDHDTAQFAHRRYWSVVEENGTSPPSSCHRTVDHGRRRWQQR